MIINTGSRTDIPAFFSEWFRNRIREGYVLARNPLFPEKISRYRLDPSVVDMLVFCTKNPAPMIPYLEELSHFRQFWFVTITPYGRDIEPCVPDKREVMRSFRVLSEKVQSHAALYGGRSAVSWRYDPIFISEKYSVDYHIRAFEEMAGELEGATDRVVISFIDLYAKTVKNFPEVMPVSAEDKARLCAAFAKIAASHGMRVRTCLEDPALSAYGVDVAGCMTQAILEQAAGEEMQVPSGHETRKGCHCLLGNDIGQYNTCGHGCRYCYANYDRKIVEQNLRLHDPSSPLLIGRVRTEDEITDSPQSSWLTGQLRLDLS